MQIYVTTNIQLNFCVSFTKDCLTGIRASQTIDWF